MDAGYKNHKPRCIKLKENEIQVCDFLENVLFISKIAVVCVKFMNYIAIEKQ